MYGTARDELIDLEHSFHYSLVLTTWTDRNQWQLVCVADVIVLITAVQNFIVRLPRDVVTFDTSYN